MTLLIFLTAVVKHLNVFRPLEQLLADKKQYSFTSHEI